MKAYEVKSETKVKLLEDAKVPPGALPIKKGDIIKLHKLDGMYCNGISEDGNRIYVAASTEVEILES